MGWISEASSQLGRKLDGQGQPLNRFYRSAAVEARQVDELIGLVKGVLADGIICQGEIEFLLKWLEANRSVRNEWPACALYPRIAAALADGHVDAEEEAELMSLLLATVGGIKLPAEGATSASTQLPLCDPPPDVMFDGMAFCFTGKFAAGTRSWCETQVSSRGGTALGSINKKLNFLVIGDIGSRDWLHSTHGTKIKKAIEYRDAGVPLHIISERHWFQFL